MLYPTTVGTGPFKAAVAFDSTLYVKDTEYATEQEAYNEAHTMFMDASKVFVDKVKANCFAPRAHQ